MIPRKKRQWNAYQPHFELFYSIRYKVKTSVEPEERYVRRASWVQSREQHRKNHGLVQYQEAHDFEPWQPSEESKFEKDQRCGERPVDLSAAKRT